MYNKYKVKYINGSGSALYRKTQENTETTMFPVRMDFLTFLGTRCP